MELPHRPDANALIEISQLTKRYGRRVALDAVSFDIRAGEILGLIGPNGAGKTTLFECLAGLLPIDGGTIRLAPGTGHDRTEHGRTGHDGTQHRRTLHGALCTVHRLFYLPDGIAPWPHESVQRALEFSAGFFGGRRTEIADIVTRLDLGHLQSSRVGELSKGELKRVILAVGLLAPQPILLVDEPFDGLDLRQSRQVAEILHEHGATGRTLFLSIHQINEAARICDRFVLLAQGRVMACGTLDELTAMAARHGHPEVGRDLEEIFLALT